MLSGEAQGVNVTAADERMRRIEVRDVAMGSRNRPDSRFTLSGEIVATRAEGGKFEKELARFEEERGYRRIE
jgi:hypothetical protein